MGQVVLADDDFNVNAEIAFVADNLDDATTRILGRAGPVGDLAIDNHPFEIFPGAAAGFAADDAIDLKTALRLGWLGDDLLTWGDDDIHLDAVVDGAHVVFPASVVEGSNHGGMGALHDADDTAFETALAGVRGKLDQNLVTVHCLAGIGGRDEDIALEALANFRVYGTDEAEAITMHGEASDEEIAIDRGRSDGVPVAGDEDQFAAHHEIGEERFQFLALAAPQRELADELLVSGGMLGLVFDVLEQIAFRDHFSMWMVSRWWPMCECGRNFMEA